MCFFFSFLGILHNDIYKMLLRLLNSILNPETVKLISALATAQNVASLVASFDQFLFFFFL